MRLLLNCWAHLSLPDYRMLVRIYSSLVRAQADHCEWNLTTGAQSELHFLLRQDPSFWSWEADGLMDNMTLFCLKCKHQQICANKFRYWFQFSVSDYCSQVFCKTVFISRNVLWLQKKFPKTVQSCILM